jgi:integrase/recombinase XerC
VLTAEPFGRAIVVPELIADAGDKAARRYANFFGAMDNDNTRAAYMRAGLNIFTWCESEGIEDLADVEPFHVGAYVKVLGDSYESEQ